MSAVARARRREDVTSRLKRHIEQAQAHLEEVMKEEEEAVRGAEDTSNPNEAERQAKFDELIGE